MISDINIEHANIVKQSVSIGYGQDISSRISIHIENVLNTSKKVFLNNSMAIIRSTTGINNIINPTYTYYSDHNIQYFMPLGSNDPNTIITLSTDEIPHIVTCGAGDTDNDTAYGNGLEFVGLDSDGNPSLDQSSYANGYICGQLLKIKETLSCTWWEARYRARMTGSNNGTWNINDGYGFINVNDAIAYSGEIIADPYL